MALEPSPGIGGKFKHRPAFLEVLHQGIKQDGSRVHMPDIGAPHTPIEVGVVTDLLDHVPPHQQIVGQPSILLAIACPGMVFFQGGGEQLRQLAIRGVVGGNDRLREAIHQVGPDVFHRGLDHRGHRPGLALVGLGDILPMVPMVDAFTAG